MKISPIVEDKIPIPYLEYIVGDNPKRMCMEFSELRAWIIANTGRPTMVNADYAYTVGKKSILWHVCPAKLDVQTHLSADEVTHRYYTLPYEKETELSLLIGWWKIQDVFTVRRVRWAYILTGIYSYDHKLVMTLPPKGDWWNI